MCFIPTYRLCKLVTSPNSTKLDWVTLVPLTGLLLLLLTVLGIANHGTSETGNAIRSATTTESIDRFLSEKRFGIDDDQFVWYLDDLYLRDDDAAPDLDDPSTEIRTRNVTDIRFNKCPPNPDAEDKSLHLESRNYVGGVHKGVYPLMPKDYPVAGEKATILARETMAESVMTLNDYQLFGATSGEWMTVVKPPYYPSEDPNAPFWEQMRHVVEVQKARRRDDNPSTLSRWPDLWADFDLDEIAQAVRDEYPGLWQQQFITQIISQGGLEMDTSMRPFRSTVDFLGTEIRLAALNTWAIDAVGPINFMLKWAGGVPRPEEMAWLIANRQFGLDDGVPADIIDDLLDMDLTQAEDFTAYSEGSPMHPSWPAMHSAGSVCSFWLPVVAKLTPEQYCEALRVDYGVSYARTVAGVHYPMDNYAGLNLGMSIIKEKLPKHLKDQYGYDEAKVRAKLNAMSFDWETFDPFECTIGGVAVEERML